MHAKAKAFLENLRTEPSRNSAVPNFSGTKNFDRPRALRTEKSPNSHKGNLGRQLLKSPDINCSSVYSSRYNKSSTNILKNPGSITKPGLTAAIKEPSQSFQRSKEVQISTFSRSDADPEVTERATISAPASKKPVEAELSECLKRYMGGFSQFENSCVTTYCVNHQDHKTEFCANFGQLLIGFCAACAVKFAAQSLPIRPYNPPKSRMSKKSQIDSFLRQIAQFKKVLAHKRGDLSLANIFADKLDLADQRMHVEEMFEEMVRALRHQKDNYAESFVRYWNASKRSAEERLEILTTESKFIDKIEADISENYQSILENVKHEDFEMILAHHQAQFNDREKLVEKLSTDLPKTMTPQLATQFKEKLLATLDEQITASFPGIETKTIHFSLPTFKNFSPQNADKGGTKPMTPIPEEVVSETQSVRDLPHATRLPDSDLKNIPSIDNFLDVVHSEQVLTDSHHGDYLQKQDSDERLWEDVKGNCFLSVDPSK
jgi:hypothetical protein